jgi:hypothetical protein
MTESIDYVVENSAALTHSACTAFIRAPLRKEQRPLCFSEETVGPMMLIEAALQAARRRRPATVDPIKHHGLAFDV